MSYSVCRVDWQQAEPLLKDVREKVFVCEWRIPKRIEFDRHDKSSYHILVCDDKSQEPIATGRIKPSGEISRIAVLINYRHLDIDTVVIQGLLQVAQELELKEIFINAPLHDVTRFQQRYFTPQGGVYMEAGIPFQKMACKVKNLSAKAHFLSH
ncbi:GNAT family N-acetyltransferase [Thalassotalea sp. LPB0316]|uniref:GNAT family N-acetyltransferase n=1 Tax=Thalassotalea sp. LPB0316 TaxID=2769490 RepID=UPI001868597B|nr:GNAT family N-acetyltransferase [Thalassotalea sp. LPB0316]QOL24901.1 GNAT family N-acetyltransferase [Thalassotalea sp. LPB0316]